MKETDHKVLETAAQARQIAQVCLSQQFGDALYKVTTSASPESECPTIPNQENLSLALKVIQAAKHIAPLFTEDPTSTNIEKTVGSHIQFATSLLQKVSYDLKQPQSYIRNSFSGDKAQSALATVGTGLIQLGSGIESLLSGVSQMSGADQNVYDSLHRALNRESAESASLAASSSSSSSSISTSTTTSSITVKQEAPASRPPKHKLETDDKKEDLSAGKKPLKRGRK